MQRKGKSGFKCSQISRALTRSHAKKDFEKKEYHSCLERDFRVCGETLHAAIFTAIGTLFREAAVAFISCCFLFCFPPPFSLPAQTTWWPPPEWRLEVTVDGRMRLSHQIFLPRGYNNNQTFIKREPLTLKTELRALWHSNINYIHVRTMPPVPNKLCGFCGR